MATTYIHAVTSTLNLSLDYIQRDKVEEDVRNNISQSVLYAVNDKTGEVTYYTLSSFHMCAGADNALKTFERLAWEFGSGELLHGNAKTADGKPILAWHLTQSFDGEEVTPQQANEIGRKMAEELFPNFPAVISTHTNTDNIHNHIEFCAWNFDGKKYNYDHKAYDKIRSVSDRLCKEYGLRVLEHTQDRKLVAWQDEEGKTRYFEPTDRKINLIKERESGMASPDDVNSYRNTMSYDMKYMKEQSHIEIVKQAIDQALPYATSYEHLLRMLREAGFDIRAKKKNGDWLKHITFTPIGAERGVRDSSIDKEGGYYCRENLTKIIEENNRERKEAPRPFRLSVERTPPYFADYKLGETDIEQLDEYYRTVRFENRFESGYRVIERSEPESLFVRDIKRDYSELIGYDSEALETVARLAQQNATRQRGGLSPEYKAKLEKRIQQKLDELYFVERKEIYSLTYLKEQTNALRDTYKISAGLVKQMESTVTQYEQALEASATLAEVKSRMEKGRGNTAYMMEQYGSDLSLMRKYAAMVDRFQLQTPEGMAAMRVRIEKKKESLAGMNVKLKEFQQNLTMYERCLRSLERITNDAASNEQRQREKFADRVNFTVPVMPKAVRKPTVGEQEKKNNNSAPGDGDR